jgi:hypothetical protein
MDVPARAPNEPFCGNCGYTLTGLTESSKCPECGKPLVEVLTRQNLRFANSGKRYRSKATLFGLPVIDVALGPKDGELRGKARGIIAIGDIATGGVALGGMARGVVAVGGMAVGVFAMGGLAVGLIAACGGLAVGGLAAGGGGVGVLASGGGAAGVVAQSGGAVGVYVRDARGFGRFAPTQPVEPFDSLSWFFGPARITPLSLYQPMLVTVGITLLAGAVIGMVAWLRLLKDREPRAGS